MEVTDERRAQLSEAGKRGGRRRWIKHPVAPEGIFDEAQRRFRESFLIGHVCKACPAFLIDQSLPDAVKRTVAERLRRDHYRRLAERSAAKRRSE
jgi:hypothetical protein